MQASNAAKVLDDEAAVMRYGYKDIRVGAVDMTHEIRCCHWFFRVKDRYNSCRTDSCGGLHDALYRLVKPCPRVFG